MRIELVVIKQPFELTDEPPSLLSLSLLLQLFLLFINKLMQNILFDSKLYYNSCGLTWKKLEPVPCSFPSQIYSWSFCKAINKVPTTLGFFRFSLRFWGIFKGSWEKIWIKLEPPCSFPSVSSKATWTILFSRIIYDRSGDRFCKFFDSIHVFFQGGPLTEREEELIGMVTPIAQWLGSSNSCINPILYAFFNKKYRRGFAAIIRSKKCCGRLGWVIIFI